MFASAAKDLNTTLTIMNLSIAFYCLAVAVAPLWWTTLAENLGSRTTYAGTGVESFTRDSSL